MHRFRGGAPIGAGGGHDSPLFEAKGDGGHNLGIIHMHCYLFVIKHTAHYKHTVSIWVLVLPHPTVWHYSDRDLQNWDVECRKV